MITKHNDFTGLEELKKKSPTELRAIVAAGLIQIGSFDTEKVADQQDVVLSPDFSIGWSHPNDIRTKGFKVDYSKYKNPPRSFARIFSKSRDGALSLRDGMVKFAEQSGLTPDHAYNWSRIFDSSRFAVLTALVELQSNPDLRSYIKTVPLIGNFQQFKNWIVGAPTDSADFGILDQRSVVNLSNVANKVLRDRLTPKECWDMRQDHLEAKAQRQGQPFKRAEFREHPPEDRKPRGDRPFNKGPRPQRTEQRPSGDSQLDRFRSSVERDIPRAEKATQPQQRDERHTMILSAFPNHEERQRSKKQKQKRHDNHSRKESRWN